MFFRFIKQYNYCFFYVIIILFEGDKMYSLFIDTHSNIINLAIYFDYKLVDSISINSNNNHSRETMTNISKLLEKNNLNKALVNELIVVNGPGSFTGIRIGVTIAKTWAYLENITIKTINYLELQYYLNNKKNDIYYVKDNKGYYVYFNNEYFYLTNIEMDNLLLTNNKTLINILVDFEKMGNIFKNIFPTLVHSVNPFYIKNVSGIND